MESANDAVEHVSYCHVSAYCVLCLYDNSPVEQAIQNLRNSNGLTETNWSIH